MKKILLILLIFFCLVFGIQITACNANHEHEKSSVLKYDTTHHWYECEVEGCLEIFDKSEHVWDSGVETVAPTCTTKGVKTYTCTDCIVTKTEDLPMVLHEYSTEWSYDEEEHWYELVCGCEGEKKDNQAHIWNSGVISIHSTCYRKGLKTYECTICKKTKTEDIPTISHSFLTEWISNKDYHWHLCECEDCTEILCVSEHDWDSGVEITPATCLAEGSKTYTCTVCSRVKTEVIPMIQHAHSFEKIVIEPTCVSSGYTAYMYSCGISYVSDYVDIDETAHKFGKWVSNGDGTRSRICNNGAHIEVESEENILDTGYCGENLSWTLYNDGLLKISGYGPSYDYIKGLLIGMSRKEVELYVINNPDKAERGFQVGKTYDHENAQYVAPWYKYRQETHFYGEVPLNIAYTTKAEYNRFNPNGWTYDRIEVEKGITYLGDWLFYRICGPVELTIPEGVEKIGRWCIRFSPTLKSVTLPNSLVEIEERGVSRLEVAETINVGNGLKIIGNYAFAQNSCLKKLTMKSYITSLGKNVFAYNESLESVEFKSLKILPAAQFSDCTNLKEVVLPEDIKIIKNSAFYNGNIEKIKIPESINTIEESAFYGCNKLETVYVDSAEVVKGSKYTSSFGFLFNNAKSVYIREDITELGGYINNNFIKQSSSNGYVKYVRK